MLQALGEPELTEVSTAAKTEGKGEPRGGKQDMIGFCYTGAGVFKGWSEMVSWRSCEKMMRRGHFGEIWGQVHVEGTS